ncbi:MAG: GGDEF domain-containing protein [Bacilli bacterium]|nr:GGDEF domain-containing protein [Bacilli bacterium]
MTYSLFVLVCLIIHVVVNIDIFRRKSTISLPAIRTYRVFVISIASYFLVDFLWGIFDEHKLALALYVDTTIYFLIMGFTILAWARYVVKYLQSEGWFAKITLYIGNAFFLAEIVLLIVNIFTPILFTVNQETCEYTKYKARDIMLYVQILLYFLLIVYSTIIAFVRKGIRRRRYLTISLYSLVMTVAIIIQIYDPLLPTYSVGCIIGAALLNAFVIDDIKEEYKSALDQTRVEVKKGQEELLETKAIAYTDPLTNIKNKHAYVEEEERIDKLINKGEMEDFAVVVFDLNGLKHINDTKGHGAGDLYIVEACHLIEEYFGSENLYRFGGDEFVAILTGENYKNRNKLMANFEKLIDGFVGDDKPIISSGISRYKKGTDNTYHAVFYRADKIMYSRKEILKEQHAGL